MYVVYDNDRKLSLNWLEKYKSTNTKENIKVAENFAIVIIWGYKLAVSHALLKHIFLLGQRPSGFTTGIYIISLYLICRHILHCGLGVYIYKRMAVLA